MNYPHISVLLQEVLETFSKVPISLFIDGTLGAGGHSEALLHHHPEIKKLIGIDQDPSALELAKSRLSDKKTRFHLGNFSEIERFLNPEEKGQVQGILVDLGVSSMQLDQADRGFSFMREGPLDMRMDQARELTAEKIINEWDENEIANLFYKYGEEKDSRKFARAIVKDRAQKPFKTTKDLASLMERIAKRGKQDIHPATRCFQALRIAVNDELGHLERFIPKAIEMLSSGGRLAIITFHSLEDRIVKQQFAYFASDKESTSGLSGLFIDKTPLVKLITKKPIEPTQEEIQLNPRSRSANLRVIEKI